MAAMKYRRSHLAALLGVSRKRLSQLLSRLSQSQRQSWSAAEVAVLAREMGASGSAHGLVVNEPIVDWLRRNPRDLPVLGRKKTSYVDAFTGEVKTVEELEFDANGYVLYEGPSMIDGEPIVVIGTGFLRPSSNKKTAPMIQTWIMRSDMSPQEAVWAEKDASICGDCPHRGQVAEVTRKGKKRKKSVGRSCYVVVAQAPLAVYKHYRAGGYPRLRKRSDIEKAFAASPYLPRIGSYGDPAAAPLWLWKAATRHKPAWTGYTSLWKEKRVQPYKSFLMASTPTKADREQAKKLGWRTFRVGFPGQGPEPGNEVICPATPEGGMAADCASCTLCQGTASAAKDVVVAAHGGSARAHVQRFATPEQLQDFDRIARARRAVKAKGKKNPNDREIAALERAARQGDPHAAQRLQRVRRRGVNIDAELQALAKELESRGFPALAESAEGFLQGRQRTPAALGEFMSSLRRDVWRSFHEFADDESEEPYYKETADRINQVWERLVGTRNPGPHHHRANPRYYRPRFPSNRRLYVPRSQDDCATVEGIVAKSGCDIGQPVLACGAAPVGSDGLIFDSEGRRYRYRVEVLELGALLASHTKGLRPSAGYPQEFQARDRSAPDSRLDLERMARQLDPERLAQLGPTATEGAPVIWGRNNIVLAGNGRVIALRQADKGLRKAYYDLIEKLTGKRGVLVRRLDAKKPEALAFAAASQRSASAPETPIERSRALLRSLGQVSYEDLANKGIEVDALSLRGLPLDAKTVGRFEERNRRFSAFAFPDGGPSDARARAERFKLIFLALLPEEARAAVSAMGLEVEQLFLGLAPALAEFAIARAANGLPKELLVYDPIPRLMRAAPLMNRYRGQSAASIVGDLITQIETPSFFPEDDPYAGLEPADVAWIIGLLYASRRQAPEKVGASIGKALIDFWEKEAGDYEQSMFGYEPDPMRQVRKLFKSRVEAAADRFEALVERLGLAGTGRRNPLLMISNPSNSWQRMYPYQQFGARWLSSRRAAILADEMGLGKTVQALMAVPQGAPLVIVCPSSVKQKWKAELERWRPDYRGRVLVMKGRRGRFRWPGPGLAVILNYDILPPPGRIFPGRRKSYHAARPKYAAFPSTVLIADEVHGCKGEDSKRSERLEAMCAATLATGGRCFGLTGTPLENRPPDLLRVLEIFGLVKEAFGSEKRFHELFPRHKGEWLKPSPAVARKLRRVMLRRERKDVLPDLPNKRVLRVKVSIGGGEGRRLTEIQRRLQRRGIDVYGAARSLVDRRMPAFEEMAEARAILARAKIPAVLHLVSEFERMSEPLFVYSCHRAPIDELGRRRGWATITGETSSKRRRAIEQAFQRGAIHGIAATTQAIQGLDFTRACNAIEVDLSWKPTENDQAADRLARIGQTRPVTIYRIIANHPLDARALELNADKSTAIGATVGAASMRRNPSGKLYPTRTLDKVGKDDGSYRPALKMTRARYGEPTGAIPIRPIPGASKFLTPIGQLARIEYIAADGVGEPKTLWFHDAGDQGEGERPSKPPILAHDPMTGVIHFAQPQGVDMRFTTRGIIG